MRPDGSIEAGDVLLGKYQIESLLGRGGMGLVYRARHLHLHEPVAIKVMRSDVQLDEEAVERFKREAQAAVKLKSEHVARIHDVGAFPNGSPYMVMEFLSGADLGTLVDTNGPTDVPTAVDLILQACDALAEAHSVGIVHRDVKPSNLMVTAHPDGTHVVKILDFGISKSATGTDLSLTQTASVLGTPAYMSPEQMRSARRVDVRTDIWSLGTVLYELVEARRPFRAETFSEMCVMAAVDPYDPLILAPELDGVIGRCLAKAPEGRYQTIAELAAALAPFARDPARAAHYVARAQRVLGRAATMTPTPSPGSLPQVPMPRTPVAPPRDRDPGTLAGDEAMTTLRPRRTAMWAAIAALLVAAVTSFVIWQSQRNKRPSDEGEKIQMQAITDPDAAEVVAPDAAIAVVTPDAAVASTGPGSGSAKRNNAGSNTKRGSGGTKRGSNAAIAGKGSGSARPEGSAPPPAGSATTKKCNVWESRTGCK